jgi:signal transduction histidine kinase
MKSRFALRFFALTTIVSGLLLCLGIGAAWYVHRTNQRITTNLANNLASTLAAERLVLALRDARLDLECYRDTADREHVEAAAASLREIKRLLAVIGDAADDDEAREVGHRLGDAYRPFSERIERIHLSEQEKASPEEVADLLSTLNDGVLTPAENLLLRRQKAATASSQRIQVMADRVGLGLLLLGACGAAAGVLIGYGIARSVNHSIVQLRIPVRDLAGKLNEVVGPITVSSEADISEIESAMRMLADHTSTLVQQLQDSLHQNLRSEQMAAFGQLAAGLAHELRNPLASMKLLVQVAAEREDEPAMRPRDLQVLEEEISRLEKMVEVFLDYARPPRPERQLLDARELVEKSVEVVRLRAERQGVRIHVECHAQDAQIRADASQLRQMLLNLLFNALDALPEGGNVTVELATGQDPREAKQQALAIRVKDDGTGFPPEEADHLFEPFVSTKDTGIGLGLAICRQIVESHGGVVSGENQKEGARFTVLLPFDGLPSSSKDNSQQQTAFAT